MFRIQTIYGQHIADVEEPNYVKRNKNSGSWIKAESSIDAEAVAVNGQLYNIAGYPAASTEYQTVEILEMIARPSTADNVHMTQGFAV